jgi:hypothetical protein
MSSSDEELNKVRFFYELASKSGDYVQKAAERLGEKVRWFITSASTLVPIVIGLGYYILKETTDYWIFLLFLLSLTSLFSAIIIGIFLQRPAR